MTIAVADSWEARSTTATVNVTIPADTVEIGDILVAAVFCAGGPVDGTVPTDDAGNTYVNWTEASYSATYTYTVGITSAFVDAIPTQVTMVNPAGGANDAAAVVIRVTHDGTGWLDRGSPVAQTSPSDDPTTSSTNVVGGTPDESFAGPGSALFIAALTHDGATTTLAPQSGWTEVEEEEDGASGIPYSVVTRVYTAQPGTITHQWTTGAARDYGMVIAGFTENISDLELSTVSVAPSPTITGLTMDAAGPTAFPDPADYTYHVLIGPPDAPPDMFNAELVRVIGLTGSTWTIERGQAGTRAHAIESGWIIWRDHIYANNPQGLITEAASTVLKTALATIPWP